MTGHTISKFIAETVDTKAMKLKIQHWDWCINETKWCS